MSPVTRSGHNALATHEARTTPGFVCNVDDHVTSKLLSKNELEGFGRHVPSFDHPFFALFDKNHRHETEGGFT